MAKPSGMTPKPPEPTQDMQEDQDYRERWNESGSVEERPQGVHAAKEFHFREAGVQRFNDIYDWDDDEQ